MMNPEQEPETSWHKMNEMQKIKTDSAVDLMIYQDILANLHQLYARAPMANQECKQWIREIGGHVEYLKATIAAAEYFEQQENA